MKNLPVLVVVVLIALNLGACQTPRKALCEAESADCCSGGKVGGEPFKKVRYR